MPDQVRTGRLDQRHEAIFQPVHFFGPQLDVEIGKALEMANPATHATARLEHRDLQTVGNQTLRRGQPRGSGANNNHRSDTHAQSLGPDLLPTNLADGRRANTFVTIVLPKRRSLLFSAAP